MFISDTTRTAILVTSTVVASIAIGLAAGGFIRARRLPAARIVEKRRMRGVIQRGSLVSVAAACIASYWAVQHHIRVLVVRNGGSSVYGNRLFEERLASSVDEYPVVDPPARGEEKQWFNQCWIINLSNAPLQRREIEYDAHDVDKPFEVKKAVVAPPGSRMPNCLVEYFGKDDAPPKTPKKASGPLLTFGTWIDWD
jgi:hypothetical protein